jgi:hypothetical protein
MNNPFETHTERILTKEEVVEIISNWTNGAETVPEFTREIVDESGLRIYEVRVNGDKPGEYCEYLFQRKGGGPEGNVAKVSIVSLTFYVDDFPVSGHNIAEFNDESGEWKYMQDALEIQQEKRKNLAESLGVTLCTKNKEGVVRSLGEQIAFAEQIGLKSVQFDFRNRGVEEIDTALNELVEFHKRNPDVAISIHGSTSEIDESGLAMKNAEQLLRELSILQELDGSLCTVHPPHISTEMFSGLEEPLGKAIIINYLALYAGSIQKAIVNGKTLTIAIENMPTKGGEGAWGQNPEELMLLIIEMEKLMLAMGIEQVTIKKSIGITLDINHALHGYDGDKYGTVLEPWFMKFRDYIKVIHMHVPSKESPSFIKKQDTALSLATRFCPNAKIFMESKQDEVTTSSMYLSAKKVQ